MLNIFTPSHSAFSVFGLLKYLLFRIYPVISGFLISCLPFRLPFVFVRADCNHFGSWLFVFITHIYFRDILLSNKKIIVFAKENTISSFWLDYLYFCDVHVVYNRFYQFLLSPFFLSRYSIDVNGHLLSAFPFLNVPFPRLPTFNPDFISRISLLHKSSFSSYQEKQSEYTIPNLPTRPILLFYARTGNWSFSSSHSKRNFSDIFSSYIISFLSRLGYCVVLLADTPKYLSSPMDYVLHHSELNCSLHDLFSSAKGIVGSVSGATHFPSFLYDLPTLYISSLPLHHIDCIYLPPSSSIFSPIPYKDFFLLSDNLDELDVSELDIYIDHFHDYITCSDIFTSPYPYIYSNNLGSSFRSLISSTNGNFAFL